MASRFAAVSEWHGLAHWLNEIEDPYARQLVTEAVADQREIPDPEKVLKGAPGTHGVVQILRDKYIDRQLAGLTRRMSDPSLNQTELIELTTRKMQLLQLKRQPLQPLGEI